MTEQITGRWRRWGLAYKNSPALNDGLLMLTFDGALESNPVL